MLVVELLGIESVRVVILAVGSLSVELGVGDLTDLGWLLDFEALKRSREVALAKDQAK